MLPSISRFGHTHITVRIADVGGLESDMDSNVECCAITLDGVLQVSSFIVCSRVTSYQSYGTVTVTTAAKEYSQCLYVVRLEH